MFYCVSSASHQSICFQLRAVYASGHLVVVALKNPATTEKVAVGSLSSPMISSSEV